MAKDAIFARLSAIGMLVVLVQVPGALVDKADAVVRACIESAVQSRTDFGLSDSMYNDLDPKGYLLELYCSLWANDIVNKNIYSLVREQAERTPSAFAAVQQSNRNALCNAAKNSHAAVVTPAFGSGRH